MARDGGGDEDDVLMVTRAQGCSKVHLRVRALGPDAHTLCDLPTRLWPPTRLLQEAGCAECARIAVAAGLHYVRESPQVWVNLSRMAGGASS
jgi:hypothetical protein